MSRESQYDLIGICVAQKRLDFRDLEIMKATLLDISTSRKISYAKMCSQLHEFQYRDLAKTIASQYGYNWNNELSFETSTTTLNEFANGKRKRGLSQKLLNALHIWLLGDYPKVWNEVRQRQFIQDEERFVFSARQLFGEGAPDPSLVLYLQGQYKLYRPSYVNPESDVFICRFVIGVENVQNFDCTLEMSFVDETGYPIKSRGQGKIVPIGTRFFSVMPVGSKAVMVMYCDTVLGAGEDKKARLLAGTFVGSSDDRRSCAYPFYAVRVDEQFDPEVVPLDNRLPPEVLNRFKFGAVHWRLPPNGGPLQT